MSVPFAAERPVIAGDMDTWGIWSRAIPGLSVVDGYYVATDPGADEPSTTLVNSFVKIEQLYTNLRKGMLDGMGIVPRIVRPAKEVEKEYGLPEGSLSIDRDNPAAPPIPRAGLLAAHVVDVANRIWLPTNPNHELYFCSGKKPDEGWGDLPIGTIFAGGENGELLEVVKGNGCSTCGREYTCHEGASCAYGLRKDGEDVYFAKLERTNDD